MILFFNYKTLKMQEISDFFQNCVFESEFINEFKDVETITDIKIIDYHDCCTFKLFRGDVYKKYTIDFKEKYNIVGKSNKDELFRLIKKAVPQISYILCEDKSTFKSILRPINAEVYLWEKIRYVKPFGNL